MNVSCRPAAGKRHEPGGKPADILRKIISTSLKGQKTMEKYD